MQGSKKDQGALMEYFQEADLTKAYTEGFLSFENGTRIAIGPLLPRLEVKSLLYSAKIGGVDRVVAVDIDSPASLSVGEMAPITFKFELYGEGAEAEFVLTFTDYAGNWLINGKRKQKLRLKGGDSDSIKIGLEPVRVGELALPRIDLDPLSEHKFSVYFRQNKAVTVSRRTKISSTWFIGSSISYEKETVFSDDRKSIAALVD